MSKTIFRRSHFTLTTGLVLIAVLSSRTSLSQMHPDDHWVGAWATAPLTPENPGDQRPFYDVTVREIVRLSVGGNRLRVRLTNEFGTAPLVISTAHIAVSDGGSTIESGTDRTVTFGGNASITIPAGAIVLSDPIDLSAPTLSSVAVSIYIPTQYIRDITFHDDSFQTNYIAKGDVTQSLTLVNAEEITPWYFFDGVDASFKADEAGSIVALGDSITDGAKSTENTNHRWTDVLAERLAREMPDAHLSVLNEGIGGNRLLTHGYGPNASARFDRDVLSQSGVQYLILLEGINDIGRIDTREAHSVGYVNASQLELAMQQITERAHAAGLKVYGATMLPFKGAYYYSSERDAIRRTVNEWIRTSGEFDNAIDFDAITRDPQAPLQLSRRFDSGDHLHPNDAGYKAMGEAISLGLFRKRQY
jgi:lysophospholipase L1-like esterase